MFSASFYKPGLAKKTAILSGMRKIIKFSRFFLAVLVLALTAAIVFPSINLARYGIPVAFKGLEPSTFLPQFSAEQFAFTPSLVAYDKTTYVFTNETEDSDQQLYNKLSRRLKNMGLDEFEIEIRSLVGDSASEAALSREIAITIPGDNSRFSTFSTFLQLGQETEFATYYQSDPNDESTGQFTPIALTAKDLEGARIIYGSETGGYGLILDFKDSLQNQLLATALSDVNTSQESQIYLLIGGQAIAGQRSQLSSSQSNAQIVFATLVPNDFLASNYIRDVLLHPENNVEILPSGSIPPTTVKGVLTDYLDIAKIALAGILFIFIGLVILRKGILGFLIAGQILLGIFAGGTLLKIFNLPLNYQLIAGSLIASILGIIYIFNIYKTPQINNVKESLKLNNYRLMLTLTGFAAAGIALQQLTVNITGFISTASAVLLAFLFSNLIMTPLFRYIRERIQTNK